MLMQSWLRGVESWLIGGRRMRRATRRRPRTASPVSTEVLEIRSLLAANITATLVESGGENGGSEDPVADDPVLDEFDGEVPPVDGEVPPVDCEFPPVDGEVPPVDGEVPPVDGEVPPVDGEVPPVDGEVPPVDGEVPPVDGDRVEVDPVQVEPHVYLPPSIDPSDPSNGYETGGVVGPIWSGNIDVDWNDIDWNDIDWTIRCVDYPDDYWIHLGSADPEVVNVPTSVFQSAGVELGNVAGSLPSDEVGSNNVVLEVIGHPMQNPDAGQIGDGSPDPSNRRESGRDEEQAVAAIDHAAMLSSDNPVMYGTVDARLLEQETLDDVSDNGSASAAPDEIELADNGMTVDQQSSENADAIDLAFTNFVSPL